ncbi:penicillin-binding transpeptidase domain-containing protein [Enterococcus sp. BWM-S5]|uniref:Penicillin-binding transpeptidase domain-containing protein n=1 Tax=Enterococcus larvae TaxID=2794352 RepID=A0ABS4CNW4_9ENTE|nr:penicillin-binding transpeptidase domain-containing protein [Enterococcus larvae]MBP1048269.1 penicillin-binding transpeptidase domain-containing protein [Enterococcus larvae]
MGKQGNKKIIVGLAAAGIIICSIAGYFIVKSQNEKKKVENTVSKYTDSLTKQEFSTYNNLFSEESFTKYDTTRDEVVQRYETIFAGIGVKNIKVEDVATKPKDDYYEISYNLKLDTEFGEIITEKYTVDMKKADETYSFTWTPALIFPGMSADDTIKVSTDEAARGEIMDRNGIKIAENYDYQQVGITPGQLGEGADKEQNIQAISDKFGVSTDNINEKLSQAWVQDDLFVPIKTLENSLSVMEIAALPSGAAIGNTNQRHYPYGEATAHLLGYVGKVSAEDIEKNPELSENDSIGKSGLEAAFDEKLRGKRGVSIDIVDEKGQPQKTLLKIEKVEPTNITLTIDSEAQKIAYDSLGGKPSTAVISSPKTGELLVATGAPSYNPNKMVLGISEEEYKVYAEDTNLPFMSRFANRYAPGSTFKTITAAIGLDSGHITTTEERSIDGLKWQKDDSWGGFWTTRVKETPVVDLKKALVYSDNIFFAQKSLEMGEDVFRSGLNKFIFGEELDLPIYIEPASISNEETFHSDILLADTAYGQGELMISPIAQLTMYSVFMNDGALVYPQIVKDQEVKTKADVVGAESANIVLNDLIDSVASPEGYVYNLYNPDFALAAKTGTAEIKEKQDTLGTENSFLLFFDVNNRNFMGLIMSENSRENGTATEKASAVVQYLEAHYQ